MQTALAATHTRQVKFAGRVFDVRSSHKSHLSEFSSALPADLLLQPLATHNVVMTFIESRPSRRQNWDYVFFIDVDGHAEESPVADALAELEKESSLFRVLGAYPKAIG